LICLSHRAVNKVPQVADGEWHVGGARLVINTYFFLQDSDNKMKKKMKYKDRRKRFDALCTQIYDSSL